MISMDIFRRRRERFLADLPPGVVIIPAAHEVTRSNDTEFPFRQDSWFHYLTGFPEPDAVAVLRPGHAKPFVLFVRPKDREREIWTGIRIGPEGAMERYGADEAYPLSEWPNRIAGLLENQPRLYYALGRDRTLDTLVTDTVAGLRARGRQGIEAPVEMVDPTRKLAEMRLFKTADEVPLLEKTFEISAEGHLAAMRLTKPGMYEYEIQAAIEYEFRRRGASYPGYGTIVAGGGNAAILHYVENSARLEDGQLLLIDAGAEYAGYSGDITRTFPVGQRFEGAARAAYEVVLRAQEAAVAACRPGNTLEAIHDLACRILTEGLIELGVLRGSVDEALETKTFREYYMHGTGHWLGLDVHDVGAYRVDGKSRPLEPGMLFTVEPGLYFHPSSDTPAEFHGIGIRIEDDILITADGHRNMTAAVPKRIEDIEALRREAMGSAV